MARKRGRQILGKVKTCGENGGDTERMKQLLQVGSGSERETCGGCLDGSKGWVELEEATGKWGINSITRYDS